MKEEYLRNLKDANLFTLEEVRVLSHRLQARIIGQMSVERRKELTAQCLEKVIFAQNATCCRPINVADPKEPTNTLPPYTTLKIYENLYTCLAGWQFEADLAPREAARMKENAKAKRGTVIGKSLQDLECLL